MLKSHEVLKKIIEPIGAKSLAGDLKFKEKMSKMARILILIFVAVLFTCPVSAQSGNDNSARTPKEEIIQKIKDEVESDEDILMFVPELKKQKDRSGKESYMYSDGKQEVRLEDLDEDRLKELFKKVSAETKTAEEKFARQEIETAEEAQRRPPSLPARPPDLPPRR